MQFSNKFILFYKILLISFQKTNIGRKLNLWGFIDDSIVPLKRLRRDYKKKSQDACIHTVCLVLYYYSIQTN